MTDLQLPFEELDEEAHHPRRFGILSILLIAGVIVVAAVFGFALLMRNNQVQPTAGPAPDFTVTTFDGETITLSDLRGQVVVINFWASWCGPCRDEAKDLERIWQRYRDQGVVMLGITYADADDKSLAFIDEFSMTYPNAPDRGTRISDQLYHIQGVPETFVIDRDGNIAQFIYAPTNEATLSRILDGLLNSGA